MFDRNQKYESGTVKEPLLLAALLDDVAWAVVDESGTILDWSQGADALFGYRIDQAVGGNIQDRLGCSPVIRFQARCDALRMEVRTASGAHLPMIAKVRPGMDGTCALSFTSVFEQTKAAARLLGLVGDVLPEMVAYVDCGRRYLYANRAYHDWFGYREGELVGKTLAEILDPATLDATAPMVSKVLEGETVRYERWATRPTGETRYIETAMIPDLDSEGRYAGFLSHTADATPREMARVALVESERRLTMALESGDMGAWQYEISEDRFSWTPGMAEIHSFAAGGEAITYAQFLKGVHPEDVTMVEDHVARAMETGEYDATYRFGTKEGKTCWVESRGKLHRDPYGNPERLVGVCRDITSRRSTEQALRESEERYRHLAEAIPQIVWAANPEGNLVYANRRFDDYTGAEAEYSGKWYAWVHPEDLPRIKPLLDIARNERSEFDVAARIRDRNGAFRWHLCRIAPLIDAVGNITRWFGSCADIHELRVTQEALQEQSKALELVNRVGLLLNRELDLKRVVQALTETSTELTGARYGAFFQPTVENGETRFDTIAISGIDPKVLANVPKPRGVGILSQTLILGRTVRIDNLNVAEALPIGHFAIRSYFAVPVKTASARVIGAMVFGHPEPNCFTERHERILSGIASQAAIAMDNARLYGEVSAMNADLEKRVQERTRELEGAYREMEGFTYSVSHDLRAPLRAINSTSKMLMEDFGSKLNEEGNDMLRRQADASQRLGVLIDELLRMSRISRQEIRFEHLNLTEMTWDTITELAELVESKDLSLVIQPDIVGTGDPRLVRFVLLNLLSNAVKFSRESGTIEVGIKDDGAIFVRDQGIGFDMRYEPKLWLPFERLVSESDYPGTGIGLTNVKRIVERHGGRVWAESTIGQGSTFYFTLARLDGLGDASHHPHD